MPTVSTAITYTVHLSEREYKTITQALAFTAGITVVQPKPEDVELARELNARLLEVQAIDVRQKLRVAEQKLVRATGSEVSR